jgi:hypothetical protein
MVFSLWFAIYLLARSRSSQLAFSAFIALFALAFYYGCAFIDTLNLDTSTGHWRAFTSVVALTAAHNLTHQLLPTGLQRKRLWIARLIPLFGLVIVVIILGVPISGATDILHIDPAQIQSPLVLVYAFQFIIFAAIIYNLWWVYRSGSRLQNASLYVAVLLGSSVIGVGFLGTVFGLSIPRFIATGLVLGALLLIGYSVTRFHALVERRTTLYDFPVSALTIASILGIYILVAWQVGLSLVAILLLSVLVIFTHTAYDFTREFLDWTFQRRERSALRQLRDLARDIPTAPSIQRHLRRGLAILCHNLEAAGGFIAVRQDGQYFVNVSLNSTPVDTVLPPGEIVLDDIAPPSGALSSQAAWLAPVYGGGEQVAVIGIGPRLGQKAYTDADLYWLEDIADQFGILLYAHRQKTERKRKEPSITPEGDVPEVPQSLQTEELLSTLAYRPDPKLVKHVDDGFRNIHDYSKLGRSSLVSWFGVRGDDHIERGKLVQEKLIQILEKLRPHGKPPSDPLPREWYCYTILHDAYVEEKPSRDIMAKLYISEGTYYRTRRKALRGITRALLEMEATA